MGCLWICRGVRSIPLPLKVSLLLPLLLLTAFLLWKPLLFFYTLDYVKLILNEVGSDHERYLENNIQIAQKEWRLHQLESRYGQAWCKDNKPNRSRVTWLTALVNDKYAVPAIVLGHSLQTFSCEKSMIALLSKAVSKEARNALSKVGWSIQIVEQLDCQWMQKKLGQGAAQMGIIGTHTRFHAWNYTQYSKIIYTDSDYMPLTNIDDLFDIDSDFAAAPCGRPGILDPCFNAGILVFKPDRTDYENIMDAWFKTSAEYHCPNDQVLLWHYYADNGRYTPLPYTYNVRRTVFRPMKAYHFACCLPPKPWSAECRPSRKEAKEYDRPILHVDDLAILFWKKFYEALERYELDTWWRTTEFFRKSQEFGKMKYSDCMKCSGRIASLGNSTYSSEECTPSYHGGSHPYRQI